MIWLNISPANLDGSIHQTKKFEKWFFKIKINTKTNERVLKTISIDLAIIKNITLREGGGDYYFKYKLKIPEIFIWRVRVIFKSKMIFR